jgi:hypothetical protein
MTCEVREGWRDYLVVQLEDLVEKQLARKEQASEILELFDLEVEWKDKSEQHAYDKAQQDIGILLAGEWQ